MKKIIFLIILFLIGITKVYAYDTIETFHFGKKVPNIYVKVFNNDKIRNTTVWMIPMEVLDAIKGFSKK